ncbi:MAG: alanine dehydrogenase [Micavibrio aeruginosavorus]|uniref:Alanine dehydrogenase n=1 Tax=Micavibrio aeruginosavorus TaxID=349221 RepID=A0A2W5N4F8_9BACT|nr:MAG: alanine dehydrogenase [Micavibrio aeruginosavorus]
MIIGVPKEIKAQEHRVGLVPASVREFKSHGHEVLIETGAGAGINFTDADYEASGAVIIETATEIFDRADMIIKVKEPQESECSMLRKGQVLFTYLHLAADPAQAKNLMESGCIAIAYETVTGPGGRRLPLLEPMSEIAGRLSIQVGGAYLLKHLGGRGRLIGGSPGVEPANVVVLGGGVSGYHAADMAVGMQANVVILEKSHDQIRILDRHFGCKARVIQSSQDAIERYVLDADLVVGAVLIPGASAPKLVTKEMVKKMRPGSVLVDIAIDQGGCFETSHPTTHSNPVYTVDDVIHYCVANMPGAVPMTSAQALNNAVLPYALAIADKGWKKALSDDAGLRAGLNVCNGHITYAGVAESLKLPLTEASAAIGA